MPTARFTLSDNEPEIFEVRWSWWGREEYFFDGGLLRSLWDLSTFTGARVFNVNDRTVRIAWAAKDRFITRVYVDEVLRVDDLFPQLTRRRKPFSWSNWFKTVVIWMMIGCAGTLAYKYLQKHGVTPSNKLERSEIQIESRLAARGDSGPPFNRS